MRKRQGKIKDQQESKRHRRHLKIRKTISGTQERPRICLNKTNKHLFVQVIDDGKGKTLFSEKTFGKNAINISQKKEAAKEIGKRLADSLKNANLSAIVFDRNGYKYTGTISILADSLRENGIRF